MKTIKEIADDCGLGSHSLRPSTLEKIVNGIYTGSTLYEESLYEIIGALYRRIEFLEEIAYQHGTLKRDFHLKCFALEESHKQTDEANRRIKELEAEKEAAVDMLKSVSMDCQMTLRVTNEAFTNGDVTCMREGADLVLRRLGVEPPVHVAEEAYRDEWNCPSCGGESEDDDDARRCHPCGLRFPPAEEAP